MIFIEHDTEVTTLCGLFIHYNVIILSQNTFLENLMRALSLKIPNSIGHGVIHLQF